MGSSKHFLFPLSLKDGKCTEEDMKGANSLDNITVTDISLATNSSPNTGSRFKDRQRTPTTILQNLNLRSRSGLLATSSKDEKADNANSSP